MNKDDVKMSNDNEIIDLTGISDAKYQPISNILNYGNSNNNFLKDMLDKTQKISMLIKKIKLEEDPKYFETQSKEYTKQLNLAKIKIEKIILKFITYTAKKVDKDKDIDINNFDTVSDFVDDLLEKCSDNIDILKGKKKDKRETEIEEELKNIKKIKEMKENKKVSTMNLISKMDLFDIDNSYFPFIPKITVKHFASKELSADIEDARRLRNQNIDKFSQIKFEDRKEIKESLILFQHPYSDEIVTLVNKLAERSDIFNNYIKREYFSNLNLNRVDSILNFKLIKIADMVGEYGIEMTTKKIKEMSSLYKFFFQYENEKINDAVCKELITQTEFEYPPLEWTKFSYIDTSEALMSMIEDIEINHHEIAVDLEHHSSESYLGITCLMQISTRLQDYVIDTIKLRPHMQEINRIFCNPAIVKVLHGADFDVEWLQKDFGVYIVNMFDTGQAARVLMLPSYSLANLLNTFCNVSADKKYQLADWRIRPLPAEMLKYAREDTHYLLYIYDILRKKLIYKSSIKNEEVFSALLLTFKKSSEICLKQYIKPNVKSQEYYQILSRNITILNKRNISLLKLIYKFRDYVGRKLDINPHQVLSNKNMFNLLRLPGNKFDTETIYQNLDKNSHIRNFVPDLVKLIEVKLKKNEEKIEQGQTSKFLEKNYLENMKEKFEESKNVVKNLKVLNNNLKKSLEVKTISQNHSEATTKEDVKLSGEEIQFKTKKPSKFIEESKENFKNIQQSPQVEFNSIYNKVLENFNNFNIISYLKQKHPNLKNMKIEKKEAKMNKAVKAEEKTKLTSSLEQNEKVGNKVNLEESLLKQKRKGPEHIDLTDYKRINLFKPPQTFSDEDDQDQQETISVEEENVDKNKKDKKRKVNEIINLNSIQSENVKNMIASAKFLKDLARTSKKK